MKTIEEIVKLGDENKASDIHFSCGSPVMYRIDGEVQKQGLSIASSGLSMPRTCAIVHMRAMTG